MCFVLNFVWWLNCEFVVFFFYSPFKYCISTFDSWKLFVFVFRICKWPYIDLHESEGLKDKLFMDHTQKETNIY